VDADPHAAWGDRTPLYDDEGRLALVFTLTESTRGGRPWVDGVWRPAGIPVERACELALSAFADHAFSTSDAALADALASSGATWRRHAHTMTHDLVSVPAAHVGPVSVSGLDSAAVHELADPLGATAFAAYPPGHPDHRLAHVDQAVAEMKAIADGLVLGPLLDVSCLAVVGTAVVGACLVVDRPGAPPDGGPWVVDVFRDPAVQVHGVGTALLAGSLERARDDGLAGLSLVVSHDNGPARRLYDRLGFVQTSQSWTLLLP
jgi:GNAT superfamily N-acetyltransferase